MAVTTAPKIKCKEKCTLFFIVYYSLYPSLTKIQPEGLATPKQWITSDELGEVSSGLVEKVKAADAKGTEKYKPADLRLREKSSDLISLTVWGVRHPNICSQNSK